MQFILTQFSRCFALQPSSDQNPAVEIVLCDFITVLIWTVRSTINGPDSKRRETLFKITAANLHPYYNVEKSNIYQCNFKYCIQKSILKSWILNYILIYLNVWRRFPSSILVGLIKEEKGWRVSLSSSNDNMHWKFKVLEKLI
jgi:hypothetical protein